MEQKCFNPETITVDQILLAINGTMSPPITIINYNFSDNTEVEILTGTFEYDGVIYCFESVYDMIENSDMSWKVYRQSS